MQKVELRKIRKLNATKEMIQKAVADNGAQGKDWRGRPKTFKRAYGMFMRCQCLNGLLKVAIFLPKDMKKGIATPRYEIFIDYNNDSYITRELKNGIELRWNSAKIQNLEFDKVNNSWGYLHESHKEEWINASGNKHIKSILKVTTGGYEGILEYQERIKKQKIEEQRRKETEPWDADMKLVPNLPIGFERWWKKEAIAENYIFYKYEKKGTKTGYCSYCEKEVPVIQPKHGKQAKCQCCKRKITYKAKGKITTLSGNEYKCQIIQPIKEGFVVRSFYTRKGYYGRSYDNPKYSIHEYRRVLYRGNAIHQYDFELYKNDIHRWCRKSEDYGYHYSDRALIYKRSILQLEKTVLKQSALPILIRKGIKISVERYLFTENGNPAVEKLVKIGMIKMAIEMMERKYDPHLMIEEANELTKILRIDKNRLQRLKQMDSGIVGLRWMQQEKMKDKVYPNELITYFEKEELEPEDLNNMRSYFLSDVQIWNYMKRQQDLIKEKAHQILDMWSDYINMAKKAKMPVTNEMIYKPKNIKEKHNEMILILQSDNIKKMAKERLKQFPKVNEVCEKLGKYEYQNETYTIMAPKCIEDIIKEGIALQHCIHTCDFYFDRINKKETYLLFLRKTKEPSIPYYTLEVEPSGNIRQKRTTGDNQNKDFDDAIGFLKKWQKEIKKRLSAEDKELGKKAETARIKEYEKLRKEGNRIWHGKLAGKLLVDVLEEDFMSVI